MTFPQNIERWRNTVNQTLSGHVRNYTGFYSLLSRVGLTSEAFPDVILALIQKESSGDPNASGDGGNSIGLMQLNFGAGTPQGVGYTGTKEGLKDPYTNVYFGSRYFLTQLDKYGNVNDAILAYHAGNAGTAAQADPVNQDYVQNVLSTLGVQSLNPLLLIGGVALIAWIYSSSKSRSRLS